MNITTKQISELIAKDATGQVTQENFRKFLQNPQGYADWNTSRHLVHVDVEINFELVHHRDTHYDEIMAELKRRGLRPATLKELLIFGETYPNIQREFPIVALDSSCRDPFGRGEVPYLGEFGRHSIEGTIGLSWSGGDGWVKNSRFLAVRK